MNNQYQANFDDINSKQQELAELRVLVRGMKAEIDSHEIRSNSLDATKLELLRELFDVLMKFGVDLSSQDSVASFLDIVRSIDNELSDELESLLDELLTEEIASEESALRGLGIENIETYQDFTMRGDDWGTIYSALLSYLLTIQKEEKYEKAVRVCDALLKYEEPYASGGPFLIKCECLTSMGKLDEAALAYEEYIAQSDPATDTTIKYAYYNLGNIYYELKRYAEAKDLFVKANKIDPAARGPRNMLEKLELMHN